LVDTVFIAGAGHAGGRCALLLRHKGFEGRVVLVGEENFAPYERPPLSKGLLQGTREAAQCLLVPESEYAAQGIELMLGKRVQSISIEGSSAQLDSGESLEYDRLVIATGGLCRKMDCKGIDLNGIHDLRTMADSGSIKEFLEPGRNVVIVGGGFIGLETAACAIESGCNVHIVEAADSLLGRVLPACRMYQGYP
jgi:3-phenylpropionate/trans-cinnamate dioxygenase ferredoxin reductase subunit